MKGLLEILPAAALTDLDIDVKTYMPLFIIILLLGSIFILFRLFRVSTPLLWRLLINGALGAFMLLFFNVFFYIYLDMEFFSIPVNWVSAVIAGVLGVPGVLLLMAFKLLR